MSKRYCVFCGKTVKTSLTGGAHQVHGKAFAMRIYRCDNCNGWIQYDVLRAPDWERKK